MNEQLRDQISAFLDGELAAEENELLVRRLSREDASYAAARRYLLIGQALRGEHVGSLADRFHQRVMDSLDAEAPLAVSEVPASAAVPAVVGARRRTAGRWRQLVGDVGAVAAVALGVVVVVQFMGQPSNVPSMQTAAEFDGVAAAIGSNVVSDLRNDRPAMQVAAYLLSHSEYAAGFGRMSTQSVIGSNPPARDESGCQAEGADCNAQ